MQVWKTVRVFISSTFRDMQAERDHLVRFVFPRLREELLKRRIHLVDVDLRWGVRGDEDVLEACREIIDECRPRFICILGGRYGFTPPGKEHSITAEEVKYGVLDRLGRHGYAFFYFRQPTVTASMVEKTPGEFREPAGSENEIKLNALKNAIIKARLNPFIYPGQWDEKQSRLAGLKEFGERVYTDLLQSIEDEFGPAKVSSLDEFASENQAMEAFVEEKISRYVVGSRKSILDKLNTFVRAEGEPGVFILTGEPGSGKSALLAKFCHDYSMLKPQDTLIAHFLGASPGSTNLRRLLRRFCHELNLSIGKTEAIPEETKELRQKFPLLLKRAAAAKRIILVIDGLNQLDASDRAQSLNWLPLNLPKNIRLVISCVGGHILETLRSLYRLFKEEVALEALTESDARQIIQSFLQRYHKKITPAQMSAILDKKRDKGNPLYLLAVMEELRTIGTYEIDARISELPQETQPVFSWILERLEHDPDFRDQSGNLIGAKLVSKFISLLAASRHGLAQKELTEIIEPQDPQGNISALQRLLRPYLMYRGELIDFYHGQFRQAAESRYLTDEKQSCQAHQILAGYFRHQADPDTESTWEGGSLRGLSELVYHQTKGGLADETEETLCDFSFVQAKCIHKMVFDFIQDCERAIESFSQEGVKQVLKALRAALYCIIERPELTLQSLYNRLSWTAGLSPKIQLNLKKVYSLLEGRLFWIEAAGPLPEAESNRAFSFPFTTPSSVQSFLSAERKIAVATIDGNIEIRDILSGELIENRHLDTNRIMAITLREGANALSYMDTEGIVHAEWSDNTLEGRKSDRFLLYHSSGFIFVVRADNALVAWQPESQETVLLVKDLPAPVIVLKLGLDGQSVIYVAAGKQQVIGICRWQEGRWSASAIPYSYPEIIDADLSVDGRLMLVAAKDRRMRVLETATSKLIAEFAYEARQDVILRGPVAKCAFGVGASFGLAFLVTQAGHIGSWNWLEDKAERLEDCHYLGAVESIEYFSALPTEGSLFLSTSKNEMVFSPQNSYRNPLQHTAEVTACCIVTSGNIASCSKLDGTLRWFSAKGLAPLALRPVRWPSVLASAGKDDQVIVGNQEGLVWLQQPDKEAEEKDIFIAFSETVVSLFSPNYGLALAAAKSGRALRIDLFNDKVDVIWKSTGFQTQQKILPAGNEGLFWNLRQRERGAIDSVLSLTREVNKDEIVLSDKKFFHDAAVTEDGKVVCVADNLCVRIVCRLGNKWKVVHSREIEASYVAFLDKGNFLAVVLQNQPWLEVWNTQDKLAVVAAIDLPGKVTCMSAREDRIVVGFASGELISVCLRKRNSGQEDSS